MILCDTKWLMKPYSVDTRFNIRDVTVCVSHTTGSVIESVINMSSLD